MMPKKTTPSQRGRSAFALERFVPYLMTQIYHRLNKSFSAALSPLQLNPAQWRVLANLSGRDGQTFTELLQHTALDQPTLSRTVARLARKGFIRRKSKPIDGRAVELWLTASGRRMFARALPVGWEQYRLTVHGIGRADQDHLTKILTKMLVNVRSMGGKNQPAARGKEPRA